MITCLTTHLNHYYDFSKDKWLPIQMSLIRQFAIRNELLYSGFSITECSNILCAKKINFSTFSVSIDDFLRDTLFCATAY